LADPTWEQLDANTYRCVRCGAHFPAGRNCDCPLGDSPATSGVPHTLETESGRAPTPSPGESPSADACRAEAWKLYKAIRTIAKRLQVAKHSREASALASSAKAMEIARKSIEGLYAMARHREEVTLLERYEALQRKLNSASVESRRAHAEGREH